MELLTLKSGTDYFRLTGDTFTPCPMNKATVWPPAESEHAIGGQKLLQAAGVDAEIVKLIIREEPFTAASEG